MDHANTRYDFYGSAPEIEKLYGGRYRITVRCELQDLDQDWFYENEAEIWKNFGDLYELALNVNDSSDGWEPIRGETYPNQRLVGTQLLFIPQKATPTLEFTYETLTDEFVDESQEALGETENGLLTMTRTRIANRATEYDLEVGTSNITRGSSNIYLAKYQEDELRASEGGFKRIKEVWIEKGILSVSQTFNNGRGEIAVQAFGLSDSQVDVQLSEVTDKHALTSKSESQYNGYSTTTYNYELEESFTEDYEFNGLKRISLTELSVANFAAYDFGDQSNSSPTTGLYLGSQSVDNGGSIKVRKSTWVESGLIRESTRGGLFKDTKQVTLTSVGVPFYIGAGLTAVSSGTAASTSKAVLLSDDKNNIDGLQQYIRTYLVVSSSSDTITGVKHTISGGTRLVEEPGTVSSTTIPVELDDVSGTIAEPVISSRTRKKVSTVKTIEVVNSPPSDPELAFNLDQMSVTLTQKLMNLRAGPGTKASLDVITQTGSTRAFSASASERVLNGYYRVGSGDTGTVNYIAVSTPIAGENIISWEYTYAHQQTDVSLSGDDSPVGYSETGVIEQKVRELFIAADGTTYWEVVKWTTE